MSQENVYQFGPFCLDANERVLLREGRLIPLAPKALNTLLVLVRNRGHVVEKDALMTEVWPDEIVEEGNLTQHVHMLRRALGETSGVPKYIETIPRRGYRFLGVVTEIQEETGVVPSPAQIPAPIKSTSSPLPYLLAVLPFTNASGDEKVEHLSDGVTESLINSLSRLPQLRVTARSTVFRYKNESADPVNIGRELGVRAVLFGRVGVWQKKVTIGAELLDVITGGQLWGETYYSDTEDILEVQDKIVKEISVAFQLKLSGGQERELTRRNTDSSAAYQNYLKGRLHWNKIS